MENYPESDNPPSYEEATGIPSPCKSEKIQLCATQEPSITPPDTRSIERAHLNFRHLTDEDLKEACLEYVNSHSCYGSKFIRDWFLFSIENGYTFHYRLESFGEKRESVEHNEGYNGQSIDGRANGPEPDPWDVALTPPQLFKDHQTKREIPHSSYLTPCGHCTGIGNTECWMCWGTRGETCWDCRGIGRNERYQFCSKCSGSGFLKCSRCNGTGKNGCVTCGGCNWIKRCKILNVTWKNHSSDFISASLNLPKDLIKQARGIKVFEETGDKVHPVTFCPDPKVNAASQILITKHANSHRNELIRKQRHVIRAIPITKAFYKWKSSEGEFYVYGLEKKVYFENYPQQMHCCVCL